MFILNDFFFYARENNIINHDTFLGPAGNLWGCYGS